MRIGVTGAGGFVGRALLAAMEEADIQVVPFLRRAMGIKGEVIVGDISKQGQRFPNVGRLDAIIHLVAKTHDGHSTTRDIEDFFAVNVEGTRWALGMARHSSARRVVFLSSIKVNGEETQPGVPYTETDLPKPEDDYGQTKWEAEKLLWEDTASDELEGVVVRCPLVYGAGAKGNIALLASLAGLPVPIPLGNVNNRRSLIHVENLCSALMQCVRHPAAAGRTFLVSDGAALSTTEMLLLLGSVQRKKTRLFSVSPEIITRFSKKIGYGHITRRLFSSLEIDDSIIRRDLGWSAPYSTAEGFQLWFAVR